MRSGCLTRCAQPPSCGLGGLTLSALSHRRWCPRHCEVFLQPIDPQLEPGVPAAPVTENTHQQLVVEPAGQLARRLDRRKGRGCDQFVELAACVHVPNLEANYPARTATAVPLADTQRDAGASTGPCVECAPCGLPRAAQQQGT
jgi:hypothetical protein